MLTGGGRGLFVIVITGVVIYLTFFNAPVFVKCFLRCCVMLRPDLPSIRNCWTQAEALLMAYLTSVRANNNLLDLEGADVEGRQQILGDIFHDDPLQTETNFGVIFAQGLC